MVNVNKNRKMFAKLKNQRRQLHKPLIVQPVKPNVSCQNFSLVEPICEHPLSHLAVPIPVEDCSIAARSTTLFSQGSENHTEAFKVASKGYEAESESRDSSSSMIISSCSADSLVSDTFPSIRSSYSTTSSECSTYSTGCSSTASDSFTSSGSCGSSAELSASQDWTSFSTNSFPRIGSSQLDNSSIEYSDQRSSSVNYSTVELELAETHQSADDKRSNAIPLLLMDDSSLTNKETGTNESVA